MLAKNFTLCCFILIISSCSSPEKIPDPVYYPLESGRFAEFKVERTTYASIEAGQTAAIRIRRIINDPFVRADGQLIFPLQYSSHKDRVSWQTDSVTAAWQTTDRIFEQQSGNPVIKMNLPVYEGAYWNSNAFNINREQKCLITDVGKSYQLGPEIFSNTITIVLQDDSTLLSRRKYIEIYARNVGLIRRERLNLQYCYSTGCVGKGIINSGWKEIITIQNFGKQ